MGTAEADFLLPEALNQERVDNIQNRRGKLQGLLGDGGWQMASRHRRKLAPGQ